MPSTQYESRRLYDLHVFKDTPGSNWSNPTVHIFPLSSKSVSKFDSSSRSGRYARAGQKGYPGNRDGIVNLYRLPTDQLSFLQQYVGKLNAGVEENKAKMVKDWKASIQQAEKEKFDRETKRNEERMKLLDSKRQYLKEKAQNRETNADGHDRGNRGMMQESTDPRCSRQSRHHCDSDTDTTTRDAPVFIGRGRARAHRYPTSFPPPPPPQRRRYSSPLETTGPSPAIFETPWAIEEVELTFVPENVNLVATPGPYHGFMTTTPLTSKNGEMTSESKRLVKLEVATNKIAPESFSSFAVVLSRCAGVEIPNDTYDPYQREYSPARSYYSNPASANEDEGDLAEETVISRYISDPTSELQPQHRDPGIQDYPFPGYVPPGLRTAQYGATDGQKESAETEASSRNDDEGVETESKAGDEGEDCDEGVVYIKDLKKPE